jgi:hypothetical protein
MSEPYSRGEPRKTVMSKQKTNKLVRLSNAKGRTQGPSGFYQEPALIRKVTPD